MTDADLAATGKVRFDPEGQPATSHPPHAGGSVQRRPTFELVQMRWRFAGEQSRLLGWFGVTPVRYLNATERAQLAVTVRDGRLYNVYGELHDTRGRLGMWVMDRNGTLYASGPREVGRFHHSSLVAGDAVAGAGTMKVVAGRIGWFTDNAGHYLPTRRHTMHVIDHLRSLGLQIDDHQIFFKAVD